MLDWIVGPIKIGDAVLSFLAHRKGDERFRSTILKIETLIARLNTLASATEFDRSNIRRAMQLRLALLNELRTARAYVPENNLSDKRFEGFYTDNSEQARPRVLTMRENLGGEY